VVQDVVGHRAEQRVADLPHAAPVKDQQVEAFVVGDPADRLAR
jgi:hypothetical protein